MWLQASLGVQCPPIFTLSSTTPQPSLLASVYKWPLAVAGYRVMQWPCWVYPPFTICKTVLSEFLLKWWYCTGVFKHLRFKITLKEPSFLALVKTEEIYSPSSWLLGVITPLESSLSISVSMTCCSSKSRIFFFLGTTLWCGVLVNSVGWPNIIRNISGSEAKACHW